MTTEQLTYNSTSQQLSTFDQANRFFQFVVQLLVSFFRFLLVLDSPKAKANRVLINSLFLMYCLPCFMIFGMQAVVIMFFYQIGFKLLLRAVLYK